MKFQLIHIGIKEKRLKGFRYKRLINSGIFRGNDTRQKLIDCQGPFHGWTNASAKNWVYARVREQKEGRKVHIVCDCCDTRCMSSSCEHTLMDKNTENRRNPNCYGQELVDLIIDLAKQN